jgi:predicted transporter
MKHPFPIPSSLACHVCLLAVAISVALPASAADLNKRLKVKQNLTEVVMGQVMHDFYLGKGFDAPSTAF